MIVRPRRAPNSRARRKSWKARKTSRRKAWGIANWSMTWTLTWTSQSIWESQVQRLKYRALISSRMWPAPLWLRMANRRAQATLHWSRRQKTLTSSAALRSNTWPESAPAPRSKLTWPSETTTRRNRAVLFQINRTMKMRSWTRSLRACTLRCHNIAQTISRSRNIYWTSSPSPTKCTQQVSSTHRQSSSRLWRTLTRIIKSLTIKAMARGLQSSAENRHKTVSARKRSWRTMRSTSCRTKAMR